MVEFIGMKRFTAFGKSLESSNACYQALWYI